MKEENGVIGAKSLSFIVLPISQKMKEQVLTNYCEPPELCKNLRLHRIKNSTYRTSVELTLEVTRILRSPANNLMQTSLILSDNVQISFLNGKMCICIMTHEARKHCT